MLRHSLALAPGTQVRGAPRWEPAGRTAQESTDGNLGTMLRRCGGSSGGSQEAAWKRRRRRQPGGGLLTWGGWVLHHPPALFPPRGQVTCNRAASSTTDSSWAVTLNSKFPQGAQARFVGSVLCKWVQNGTALPTPGRRELALTQHPPSSGSLS
ncbi:uncharacterized protein isoform X3 [Castor canadensis]|uniref:Uncharacterized protein isoform X3 n=1 Tax=Castor canadensis TaxID=51338 RepID=A0AC58KGB3_CASCN